LIALITQQSFVGHKWELIKMNEEEALKRKNASQLKIKWGQINKKLFKYKHKDVFEKAKKVFEFYNIWINGA
jgi:hypothetical protein